MKDVHLFAIVPVEAFQDRRLTLEQLRVLGALLTFRGKNTNTCWPSRQILAERCGYGPSKISDVTTQLCKLGWLVKTGSGGRGKACSYEITVPDSETVSHHKTVAESETVSHAETVSPSATKTVPESGTKRFPNGEPPIRVLRTDQEQTNEQTIGRDARARENESEFLPEEEDPPVPAKQGVEGPKKRRPAQPVRNAKKGNPKAKHGMVAGFELPPEWRDWAKRFRPDMDVDKAFAMFRDHWLANGKQMVDWFATWRNWVRREAQFERKGNGGGKQIDWHNPNW